MHKTVLITGASRGIGAATAALFAKRGYNVIINYNKNRSDALDLVEQLTGEGYSVIAVKADITDDKQLIDLVETAHNTFGKIDVLVNNAGIAFDGLITETDEEKWDEIFAVDLKAMYKLTNLVIPDMLNDGGKIINISSIWGVVGASCEVAYSAAKAAVIGYTKALSKELGPSNVNVNAVAPGVILTDMNAIYSEETLNELKEKTSLCRLGTAKDVAEAIYFLASSAADYITGQTIIVDGGFLD